jgi:hypothetical protein
MTDSVWDMVDAYMRLYYRKSLTEMTITETPGYWKSKTPCGGAGNCHCPIHGFLFNEGPIFHTYYFSEHGRDNKGRWRKPFLAWEHIRIMSV